MKRSKLTLLALTVTLAAVVVAGCGRKLSEEEQRQLSQLNVQLQTVQEELAGAKQQQSMYSGGVLRALLDVRVEILKTSEALLDQRAQALESGAKVTIVIPVTKDDPIRAAQLAAELEQQRAKLAQANAQAARYAGGLLQAMSLVSAATTASTVVMLEQQYFIAKYGLAPAAAQAPSDKK